MNKFNLLHHEDISELHPPIGNSQSSEFSKTSDFYFSEEDYTGSESDTPRLEDQELLRSNFGEINDATSATMFHPRNDSDDNSSSEFEVLEEIQEDEMNDAIKDKPSVRRVDIYYFIEIEFNALFIGIADDRDRGGKFFNPMRSMLSYPERKPDATFEYQRGIEAQSTSCRWYDDSCFGQLE